MHQMYTILRPYTSYLRFIAAVFNDRLWQRHLLQCVCPSLKVWPLTVAPLDQVNGVVRHCLQRQQAASNQVCPRSGRVASDSELVSRPESCIRS